MIHNATQFKKVTLVHGEEKLTNATYPTKFRDNVKKRLNELGVEVVLDDFVDETFVPEKASITTRKGKTLEADLVVGETNML